MFSTPTKSQKRLRMAIAGASGSGKTYSALSIASHLGKNVGVIDTERGSSALYCDAFDFQLCDLVNPSPENYINAIKAAANFDVLIIDSFSHAWYELLNMAGQRFENWAKVRPIERNLINAILDHPGHVLITMRTKTEYVVEMVENRSGKMSNQPRKVGTIPIQSKDVEYEFDISGNLNSDHILTIDKTRCAALDRMEFPNPGQELAEILTAWLTDGAPLPETGDSKAARVTAAMPEKMKKAEVLNILQMKWEGITSPRQLTSNQVNELIEMIQSQAA